MRTATIERQTSETQIRLTLNLDGSGRHAIQTQLPFFDHMLTQLAVHGLFDLEVCAQGDLEVDAHHTVEDVALILGQAFDEALGDRKGLMRMGQALVPMDEALCEVAVDLSGRPYCVFSGTWHNPMVGGIPTSLIEHFAYSLSVSLRANLHILMRYGNDNHHQAEALFKALARALMSAVQIDPRRADLIPSSKGVL